MDILIPKDLPATVSRTVRDLYKDLPDALREDVTGAALLAAVRACREHKPGSGSLGGYVVSAVRFAARHAVRDLTREDRRFKPVPLDTPIGEDAGLTVADVVADPQASADARLLDQEGRRDLWRAVDGLPGAERDVLTLTYGEGLTQDQAAARLGRSRQWVSRQHGRAVRALRSALAVSG